MVLLVKCGGLGVKNCGRWEIGGQKLWEVGDWGSKIVGGGRLAPLCHPPPLENYIKEYDYGLIVCLPGLA